MIKNYDKGVSGKSGEGDEDIAGSNPAVYQKRDVRETVIRVPLRLFLNIACC